MSLDFEAIFKAYDGTVVSIYETKGAFDKNGKLGKFDDNIVSAMVQERDIITFVTNFSC